jgi:hypothetical protein
MNSAGKVIVPAARETVTRPSSCGWRRPLPVVHHWRHPGRGKAAKVFVHDALAPLAHADAEARDRVTVNAGHALDGTNAVALAEHRSRGDFLFSGKLVCHDVWFVVDLLLNKKQCAFNIFC